MKNITTLVDYNAINTISNKVCNCQGFHVTVCNCQGVPSMSKEHLTPK